MIWKSIPGYEGLYEVSDEGKVRRFISGRWKLRKSTIGSNGYLHLVLCVKGVRKTFSVHKLVLESFIGPCPKYKEACHKDNNKLNNSLDNLYYGTKQENWKDTKRNPNWIPNRKGVKLSKETKSKISKSKKQTHCKHGHEFFGSNLYVDPRGRQRCRTCNRIHIFKRRGKKHES